VDMLFGGGYCILNLHKHRLHSLRSQNCSKTKIEQFCFPAAQTSSIKEQNRVMMLREGEREGRLKRKPLGANTIECVRIEMVLLLLCNSISFNIDID
jgi:hypothetical protein